MNKFDQVESFNGSITFWSGEVGTEFRINDLQEVVISKGNVKIKSRQEDIEFRFGSNESALHFRDWILKANGQSGKNNPKETKSFRDF